MATIIATAYVKCDRCGKVSPGQSGIGAARSHARERGWIASGGGLADLCPTCNNETNNNSEETT